MPAKSKKQRRAMAIAEHSPELLYARNRSLLQMSKVQLHDYATTEEKGLPLKKGWKRGKRKMDKRSNKKSRGAS